jgi:hypothetical protein
VESSIVARHLIAEGDIENPTALRQPSAPAGQPTPVIIDCGRWAEVVVLPAAIFVGRGTRFRHRNVSFIIVGRRPGSGILVAEPAEH